MTTFSSWIKKHKSLIIISIILILAAFLRLYRIGDYMTFLGDEGRDLIEVRKILSGHLVFLGPRSSAADFYYGPIYFYLITPFLWLFNYDPVGPAVFVALVGIATVFLIYYIGKKIFNEPAGLFAAALYTVSPLVIAYSRSSWNPNPLPFVSLLAMYATYKGIKDQSWKQFILVGFLLGIGIQLQYLTLFLILIIFSFIVLGHWMNNSIKGIERIMKNSLLVIGGFIIGWSPFLLFEVKHGFPNLHTIVRFLLFGTGDRSLPQGIGFLQNIQNVFFKLFGRLVARFPPPEQVHANENMHIFLWQNLTIILGIVAIIMLYKAKDKLGILLFSLWTFIGIFLFGFYKREIYDYYLGFMFPLPFLLVGNSLSIIFINKKFKTIGKLVALLIFISLFLFNLDANPFKFIPNRQKDQAKEISEFVLSKTNNRAFNFALITPGNSDHAYRYYFDVLGHQPVVLQNATIDPKRSSVTDQLLVVCEDVTCQPLGNGLWEVAGFGRAEIAGAWNVSVVKVYKMMHYREIIDKK